MDKLVRNTQQFLANPPCMPGGSTGSVFMTVRFPTVRLPGTETPAGMMAAAVRAMLPRRGNNFMMMIVQKVALEVA